jgi:hypothetical protein
MHSVSQGLWSRCLDGPIVKILLEEPVVETVKRVLLVFRVLWLFFGLKVGFEGFELWHALSTPPQPSLTTAIVIYGKIHTMFKWTAFTVSGYSNTIDLTTQDPQSPPCTTYLA